MAPCELIVGVVVVVVVVVRVVGEADPAAADVFGSEDAVDAVSGRELAAAEWVVVSLATRAPRPIAVATDAPPMSAVARRTRDRARSRAVGAGDGRRRSTAEVGWLLISCPFGWVDRVGRVGRVGWVGSAGVLLRRRCPPRHT